MEQGLTLEGLSELAGLTPNYIGSIEMGLRDPSISTIMKIAHGLESMVGELLGLPELPPDSLEAARYLTALPPEVRRPIVGALRTLSAWAERRR